MKLKELREKWEKGLEVNLCVVTKYNEVLVILEDEGEDYVDSKYNLHRYFTIGSNWDVSVDYVGEDKSLVMKIVSKHLEEFLGELE